MFHPIKMGGKVALITGAAGAVGRATALKLSEAGADLVLVDVEAAGLEAIAAQVRSLGGRCHCHQADLSETDTCTGVIAAAEQVFGQLDALCNIAGVMLPGHTDTMLPADFAKVIAVNMTAPFFLTQAAIPMLLESKGAVVNVASATGLYPAPYLAAYGASKAALIYMTKSMAVEYMNRSVRFNAVAPGGMMTAITTAMASFTSIDPAIMQRNSLPRGFVEVDDIAATVAFLASDAARGYHGACITLDNGMSL